MRMVVLEHLADAAGAFAMLFVGPEVHLGHRIEDPALDGLHAVADVGEGSRGDDGHGVRQVRLPHFVFDVDLRDSVAIQ